jgi:hypothetical protein
MAARGSRDLTLALLVLAGMAAAGCERLYVRDAPLPIVAPRYALRAWPYRDYWTGVVFNGEKIGLTHLAVLPVEGADTLYELRSEAMLAFHFLGLHKQVTLRAQDWVSADLRLQRFAYDYELDGNRLTLAGEVRDGRLVVEREAGGTITRDTMRVDEPLYPTSALALYPALHGLEVGRRYQYRVYDGQRQELAVVSQTIKAYQESDLYDGRAYRVETEFGGRSSTLWINDRAQPVLERAWGGFLFSTLESERQARGYLARASVNKRDVLVEFSRVRANIALSEPRAVTAMDVLLTAVPESFAVPSDAWQACTREPEGTHCAIRQAAPSATVGPAVGEGGAFASYVQPTPTVDSQDPTVHALALEIAGEAAEPLARIGRLVRWIQEHVDQVPVDVFSSADVLRGRKAECQGLAWLYAAFARSLGLPTRVVNGLVYSRELEGFLYHTWAESHLGAGWLPVDPTFGQVGVDATHIKLIEGERPADLLPLADIVGNVQLTILAVKPDGAAAQTR